MARRPFRDLEDDLAELEDRMGTGTSALPIATDRGTSFAEQAEAAREVLTAEECTRLNELLEEIAAESPPALGGDPSAGRKEFYDPVNGTAANRRLEPFTQWPDVPLPRDRERR